MAGYVDVNGLRTFYNILNSRWMNEQGVLGYNSNGNKYAIQRENDKLFVEVPHIIDITHAELVALRNSGNLVPGKYYKIIDYNTSIINSATNSVANPHHKFDILIQAISNNCLSENVKLQLSDNYIDDSEFIRNVGISNAEVNYTAWNPIGAPNEVLALRPGISVKHAFWSRDVNKDEYVKVHIQYKSGSHKLNIVGAELRDPSNNSVIAGDYHLGETGNYSYDNTYYIKAPATGYYRITILLDATTEPIDAICEVTVTIISRYFDENINSWDVKYTVDNNTSLYTWANEEGKGVIYYMKDENNNEAPYDFKNILFNGKYTFNYNINGVNYDGSVKYQSVCRNNIINEFISSNKKQLPNNIFNNTTEKSICMNNVFSAGCYNNTLGDSCYNNRFGHNCYNNTLGNYNINNSFGNYNNGNVFGASCYDNTLGNYNNGNVFGDNCFDNTLGESCTYNKMGTKCSVINMIGNCNHNIFSLDADGTNLRGYWRNITLEGGCSYNTLWNENAEVNQYCQNYYIHNGVVGTSSGKNKINVTEIKSSYKIHIAKNRSGQIKQFCLADLIE